MQLQRAGVGPRARHQQLDVEEYEDQERRAAGRVPRGRGHPLAGDSGRDRLRGRALLIEGRVFLIRSYHLQGRRGRARLRGSRNSEETTKGASSTWKALDDRICYDLLPKRHNIDVYFSVMMFSASRRG